MKKEIKQNRFEMRLSDSEKEKPKACAAMCDCTPTDYMRLLLWGLRPAKFPKEKYADMLGQIIKLNKNLEALTAEIKLTGEHHIDEIWFTIQNIDSAIEEMMEAIHHPFEVIEPNDVNLLPMKNTWRGVKRMTLKELGKRVIEVLSSNKCSTVPQEWLDGLEELGRRIVKALNNKRGSWGLPPSEGEVIAQALMPNIIAFFETEEGKQIYEQWKREQEEKKSKNDVA